MIARASRTTRACAWLCVLACACGGRVDGSETFIPAEDASADGDAHPEYAMDASGPVDATAHDAAGMDSNASDAPADHALLGEASPVSDSGAGDAAAQLPSTAPCLVGGNVLWVNGVGDALIYDGTQTYAAGSTFSGGAAAIAYPYDDVRLKVQPPGAPWGLYFSTRGLQASIQTGVVYTNAHPYNDPRSQTSAALTISYAATCQFASGAFRIDDFSASGTGSGSLELFTASFWYQCDGHSGVLTGCIHFEQH